MKKYPIHLPIHADELELDKDSYVFLEQGIRPTIDALANVLHGAITCCVFEKEDVYFANQLMTSAYPELMLDIVTLFKSFIPLRDISEQALLDSFSDRLFELYHHELICSEILKDENGANIGWLFILNAQILYLNEVQRSFLQLSLTNIESHYSNVALKKKLAVKEQEVSALAFHGHALYHSSDHVCFVVTPQFKVVSFNHIAQSMVEITYGRKLNVGDDFLEITLPSIIEIYKQNYQKLVEKKSNRIELDFVDDFYHKWWKAVNVPILDHEQNVIAVATTIYDVSASKLIEKQFEEISEVAKVGGWEYDINSRKLNLTLVAKQNFGLPDNYQPSIGKMAKFFEGRANQKAIRNAFVAAIEKKIPFDEELQIRKQNGDVIWVRIKGKPEVNFGQVLRLYGTFQDVNTKRLIYEELLVSQLYYKSIFEHNPYAIFSLDLEGKFTSVNQSMVDLAEGTMSELLAIDDTTLFFEEQEQERIKSNFESVKKGAPISFECEATTLKNTPIHINLTFAPVIIEGKMVAVFGIARNITERKQAEFAIMESEYRLKLVLEGANLGWWDWDIEKNIVYFDPKWWAIIGHESAEIIGHADFQEVFHTQIIHPNDLESTNKIFLDALKSSKANYEIEYRLQHKEGHYVSVLSRGYILRDHNGNAVRISGTNMDLTQIRQAEHAYQQSEANLRSVFENTDIGYILINSSLSIVSFNSPAYKFALRQYNTELKELEYLLDIFPNEEKDEIAELCHKVLHGEVLEFEKLFSLTNIDEEWFWVRYSPVKNKFNVTEGFVISLENITDRKKNEIELNKSFNLLNEQNKRLLSFSYIVSHNLRSHTSNIKSILSFLKESQSDEEREELVNYLETVSDLLHETIHNLNEVVSINNVVNLVFVPLNLYENIYKVKDVLRDQISLKDALVNVNVPSELTINYNPAYLESILLNFMSNAIKYSHPERRPIINFDFMQQNGHNILSIADNGIGIDLKKNGDKLFGLYKTFNGNVDARGVGLFISKNQIDFMGGKVEVTSEVGIGTTFKIYFK